MITKTNSNSSVPSLATDSLRPRAARTDAPAATPQGDTLTTTNATNLHAIMAQTPAIRTEVVERASALAKDPAYPSTAVIQKMAHVIAHSEDPSAQED